ncbi:TrkH family potassium uptake protein [Thiohalobacter sp. IOR34]|uniref:TrkH family potassium uptake protein n=1 Tax=Thiohalobacter sp. IOR34 TaxID=3057176 RepID=UPI00339D9D2E
MVGLLSLAFSSTLLVPALLAWWYRDGQLASFLYAFLAAQAIGLLLWLPVRNHRGELRRRDGFIVVALFWLLLSLVSALPFLFGPHLSFVNAFFEAVSGFTTTGATVISGLDGLPRSLLYYRQQLQWLGGMGLVVLAVAIQPLLGIGGMRLYRAETPGPLKEEKIEPRLAQTARALWLIYLGLTVLCALAYWLAGMTPFDAIGHSFATISTGGFSTHDASLGYYASVPIELIAMAFMLLGGINFSIHFSVWRSFNPLHYLRDIEVRTFLLFTLLTTLVLVAVLRLTGDYDSYAAAFVDSGFEVVSVITSTGFGEVDFTHWPLFLPVLLIFISFIGGCGGSTAGGMKVMRVLLLIKQGQRELGRLLHPRALRPVRIGRRLLGERTTQAIWGFFAAYIFVFVLLTLAMMAAGLDQVSAFAAVATCLNNLGPGLGEVAYTFGGVSDAAKLLAAAAMLLGRLEIFTLLVLLHPAFWRE